jgi:hypothetical protein
MLYKKKLITTIYSLLLVLVITLNSGCSIFKADPAKSTSFLPHGELLKPDPNRSPFNGSYYTDRAKFYANKYQYKKIYIAPINIEFAKSKILESSQSEDTKLDSINALEETARYFQNILIREFNSYPNHPFMVSKLSEVTPPFLTLEIAITELVPTEAAVNFLSTIAGVFVPGTGILKRFTQGSIAFEAILRDGVTKEIFVECKDRQNDKASLFTLKDFDPYGHQRAIIDDWAVQFAKLAATDDSVKVEEELPFTFNPI